MGYILNLPKQATDLIRGEEVQLSNAISEFGRSIKDNTREALPIYEEEPGSFNPFDSGWWFSNGVSIASTLSLAIPAAGTVAAVGRVGKGIGALTKMDKLKLMSKVLGANATTKVQGAGKVVAQAALSRHAENLMEAVPVFEEKYQELLDKGIPEAVAKQRAADAAANIYKFNSAFLLQDIGTFGLLSKVGKAVRGVKGATKPTWKAGLFDSAGEGFEEAYQYAVSEEASIRADIASGLAPESSLMERLPDYANQEMATSAFFGALGNTVFRSVGKAYQRITGNAVKDQVQTEITKAEEKLGRELTPQESEIIEQETVEKETFSDANVTNAMAGFTQFLTDEIQQRQADGRATGYLVGMKAIANAIGTFHTKEELPTFAKDLDALSEQEFAEYMGDNPLISKQELSRVVEVIDTIPNTFRGYRKRFGKQAAIALTNKDVTKALLGKMVIDRRTSMLAEVGALDGIGDLTKAGKEIFDGTLKYNALKKAESLLKKAKQPHENVSKKANKLKAVLDKKKAMERKAEDVESDGMIMSILKPEADRIANDYKDIFIYEDLVELKNEQTRNLIKNLENQPKPKEDKQAEAPSIPTPSNLQQVTDKSELKAGDKVSILGRVMDVVSEEQFTDGEVNYQLDDAFDSGATIYKLISQGEKERQQATEQEATPSPADEVPVEYEKAPEQPQIAQEVTAAWVSIHSPRNSNPTNPEEIARSNWAETPTQIYDAEGKPRYSVTFEVMDKDADVGTAEIRGYVYDEVTESPVMENDQDVFFWVPTVNNRNVQKAGQQEQVLAYREQIMNAENPSAMIVYKGWGKFNSGTGSTFNGPKRMVAEMLDNSPFAVLDKSLTYSDKNGIPEAFSTFGLGNKGQVGRVYTTIQGLDGFPALLPLERETNDEALADAVTSIIWGYIMNTDKPGDTISDETVSRLEGTERGKALLNAFGRGTNQEILDAIVLEGNITKGKRRFYYSFNNKTVGQRTLYIGDQTFGLKDFVGTPAEIQNVQQAIKEFVLSQPQNILRKHLGDPVYDEYLRNYVLFQKINDPMVIDPLIGFGGVIDLAQDGQGLEDSIAEQVNPEKPDDSDVQDAFNDLLEQRLDPFVEGKLIPVLNGLQKKFGIGYRLVNMPQVKWKGLVDGKVVFINTAHAKVDTAFHEYAHPIIRQIKNNSPILYANLTQQILADDYARRLYSRVKTAYPNYNTDQVVEETIVQLIGEEAGLSFGAKNALQRIWQQIKAFFANLIGDVKKVDNLSYDTSIADLAKMMVDGSVWDVQMNPMLAFQTELGMPASEFNNYLSSLMFGLLNQADVNDYTDVGNLTDGFEKLREWLTKISGSNAQVQRILQDMYTPTGGVKTDSIWYKAISEKLKAFSIKLDESNTEYETQDEVDETGVIDKPAYFFSGKDKASPFIKMMMSTIPRVSKVSDDGRMKFEINSDTGMPVFHNFNDIWNLLSEQLANIVERTEDGKKVDIFNDMLKRIEMLQELRPEMKIIHSKLSRFSSWKKAVFVSTFFKANQNYSVVRFNPNGKFTIIKNHPTSSEVKVKTKWQENFNAKWFDSEGTINDEKVKAWTQRYEAFKNEWISYFNRVTKEKTGGAIPSQYLNTFQSLLSDLGMDLSDRGIKYLLTHKDKSQRKVLNEYIKLEGLNRFSSGDGGINKIKSLEDKNFIEDQSSALDIIQAEAFFNQDLGTSSVFGPSNNSYWNYSNYSMMAKLLDYMKTDPTITAALKNIPFYKNSKWADPKILENLYVTNAMSMKMPYDSGTKMKSLNPLDRLIVDINKILEGQFSMLARGANSTEFNIVGAPVEKSFDVSSTGIKLSTKATDSLAGYLYDEMERIYASQEYIDNPDNVDKLIDGYHTEVTIDGRTFVPALTSFLGLRAQQDLKKIFDDKGTPVTVSREKFIQRADIRDTINKAVAREVSRTKSYAASYGTSESDLQKRITPESNRYNNSFKLDSFLYDYIYNGMVSNIEQQKLFAADIAMFSHPGELQKRILANGSMGINWYIHDGESEFYNSAVIQEPTYDSIIHKNYQGVKLADAQAWVTLDFYVQALKGYGKWRPEMDVALEDIYSGTFTPQQLKLFLQPLKTVHFERVIEDDLVIPVYDKQTIMPLVPALVKGTSLENLLDSMQNNVDKDGNRVPIDHVTVVSGKKLGRRKPALGVQDGKFIPNIELNPIRQSKAFTLLQTEMPHKGRGAKLQGSQQKYNILADVSPEMEHNGKNVITTVHNIQSAISNNSVIEWKNEITNEDGSLNREALYNELIEMSSTGTMDIALINHLESGEPIEGIPSHNFALQMKIMSMINKRGARLDIENGISGIKASALGFDQLEDSDKNDIVWLNDGTLRPPRMNGKKLEKGGMLISHDILEEFPDLDVNKKEDRDRIIDILSGIDYRTPNQAKSSIGMFEIVGILPAYMGDTVVTYNEIIDKAGMDNDGDKVELMMYNYIGFNRPVKVRYWTEDTGEGDWVELHAYRRDRLEENVPDTVEEFKALYNNDILAANSKRGLENYLFDMYEVILSSDQGFSDMMDKLEDSALEDLIVEHPNYEQRRLGNFEIVSPLYQVKIRESFLNAKSSVGQVSNHIVDHIKSQYKNIYATTKKGAPKLVAGFKTNVTSDGKAILFDEVKNVDGKVISKILSMFMNAQVDAEKNDYAPRGNFTTATNSVALAMVRAGGSLKDIVNIIGSKEVRDYVRYKTSQAAKLASFETKQNSPIDMVLESIGVEDLDALPNGHPFKTYVQFEFISRALSESIQKSRYSVIGGGRSFASAMGYKKFKERSRVIGLANVDNKFSNEDGSNSMEQTYYENTVILAEELFADQSIAFSEEFSDIMIALGENTLFNPIEMEYGSIEQIENLYFQYYAYKMSDAFANVDRLDLIKGDNTVAQRVAEYPKQNRLIEFLVPVTIGKNLYKVLETSNADRVDTDLANELTEAWEELYDDNPTLALDLARYAYFQSGFKRNFHSFHEFIPQVVNNELGMVEAFKKAQSTGYDAMGFVDQYIRHNWQDSTLVPRIRKATFNKKDQTLTIKGLPESAKTYNGKPPTFVHYTVLTGDFPNTVKRPRLFELVDESNMVYKMTPALGSPSRFTYHEYNSNSTKPIFSQLERPKVTAVRGASNEVTDDIDIDNNDENPLCPASN